MIYSLPTTPFKPPESLEGRKTAGEAGNHIASPGAADVAIGAPHPRSNAREDARGRFGHTGTRIDHSYGDQALWKGQPPLH